MIDYQNLTNLPEINFKSKGRPELDELADYIDHMKGKRKIKGKSSKSDLRYKKDQDYWKNVENYDPFGGVKFDPKQEHDIVSKVAKGRQGN